MRPKIVVIGNGRFAVDCLEVMRPLTSVKLIISDPDTPSMPGLVDNYCRQHDVCHLKTSEINAPDILHAIAQQDPDYVFSAYNLRIMRRALLAIPRRGTVNFHNGPLPRYRGVNVYSWAIINGEERHGVAWHLVDEGVDTGDVLRQKEFEILPDDTPFTLARKGFRAGVELLDEILEPFLSGALQPEVQSESAARYYSHKDHPNHGYIDFRWNYSRIERLVRGLNFSPLNNNFVYATAFYNGRRFHPQRVGLVAAETRQPCGTITKVGDDVIHVQIGDGILSVSEVLDESHRPLSPSQLARELRIQVFDTLEHPPTGERSAVDRREPRN